MENSNIICPACSSFNIEKSYKVPDHEYNIKYLAEYFCCSDCGTLHQFPMPSIEILSAFYPQNYHSFSTNNFIFRAKNKKRLANLLSLIKKTNAIILDYGCGDGAFIKEAAKHTNNITFWGYEISEKEEKYISKDGRVIIIKGNFEYLINQLPLCDLITMNHVIEHLPDPLQVLKNFYLKLNNGGVMEGQTPAADSLERKIFKTSWSGFHAPRHTVIFSKEGLRKIMLKADFIQVEIKSAFNPAGIAVSLASLQQGNNAGYIIRKGFKWLTYLAIATLVYPIDLLSGRTGIINYVARKK